MGLAQAAASARREVAAGLVSIGGSRSEFALLAALEEFGPLSQADVGRRIGLDRSDVTALVGSCERRELLGRHPDPADRRRKALTITPTGRARLAELQGVLDAAQTHIERNLTVTERATLHDLLDRLA